MPVNQPRGVPGISQPMGVQDPIARRMLGELKQGLEHVVGHEENQSDIAINDPSTISLAELAAIVKRILDERIRG